MFKDAVNLTDDEMEFLRFLEPCIKEKKKLGKAKVVIREILYTPLTFGLVAYLKVKGFYMSIKYSNQHTFYTIYWDANKQEERWVVLED